MSDQVDQFRQATAGGTICLVPYCHPDFAWTHHREWHEERYAVSICDALDLMAAHPEFRFCVEPWIDQVIPFLERCPDRVEELRERLNSGQMGVLAATLTSPRPIYAMEETFLRNMILGREQYLAFAPQADLSTMACPDVGIGHSQMPQVVRLAGASLYRGWRSGAAFDAKGVPAEFVWRGLDGTELLTSRGCYGGLVSGEPFAEGVSADWEKLVEDLAGDELNNGLRPDGARVRWLAQGMDDARPLRSWPEDALLPFFELAEEWTRRESSRMIFATPGEYARLLADENLPVWEGVIDPVDVAYNTGWGGAHGLWRLRQRLEVAMVLAERAAALGTVLGVAGAPGPEELRRLWWEAVRLADHAQQWVFTQDFAWLTTGARWHLREAEAVTQSVISALAGAGQTAEGRRPLVLWNPLPYEREELVEVPCVQPRLDAPGYALYDETGAEVAFQVGEAVGEAWGGKLVEAPLVFRARVPALGVAVYEIGDGPAQAAPAAPEKDLLTNGPLTLRFSPRGLQEITDAATGLHWLAPEGGCLGDVRLFEMGPGPLGVGPISADLGGSAGMMLNSLDEATGDRPVLPGAGGGGWVLTGPTRWVYRWRTEFHGHRVIQDVIVDQGARHVDFLSRVYAVKAQAFWAFCLDLPFAGALHADIPFGVEPRDLRDEPWAMDLPFSVNNIERLRRHQFWARSFASVSDGARGISLITVDGDRYWTWEESARQLRHLLFLQTPGTDQGWESYINHEREGEGWHDFRHRLMLHDGDWQTGGLCAESDRLRLPLQVVKPLGPPRERLIPAGAQLILAPETVRLSAFYAAGEGYVLRLYESAGQATEAVVELPCAAQSAVKTDFNLQPLETEPATVAGRTLRVPLRAWEIATVLLR
jgi:hypothetical protein